MTKRKRNILLITLGIIVIILAAAVGIIYAAYSVVIDYNYNFIAHADTLGISAGGSSVIVTKAGGTELTATKSDIVLISEESSGDITLDGKAASKYAVFEVGPAVFRKSVFTDMPLTSSSTAFTASAAVTGLKAAVSEAVYESDKNNNGSIEPDEIFKVKYDNIFVSSQLDFELMNFHSQYNNTVELWNNYQNKEISARTVYLLTDIYITSDHTVNIPCSIDLLASKLIIGKDAADNVHDAALKLAHSYPGVYYITATASVSVGGETLSGGITLSAGSDFTVSAPKAYYEVADTLAAFLTVTEYSGDYTPLLLTDALEFAARQLPDKFHSTLVLRQNYQTYGIKYSYYLLSGEGGAVAAEFDGIVSTFGSITRGLNTASYWIRIYAAPKSGAPAYMDKEVRVIGSGESAMLQNVLENIGSSYYSDVTMRLDVDLLNIIKQEYQAGGFSGDITVSVYESEFLENDITAEAGRELEEAVVKNSTAVRLVLSDRDDNASAARRFTVGLNNGLLSWKGTGGSGKELKYLIVNKGITTLSDKLYIKLSSTNVTASAATTREYDLAVSTRQEVTYYLKSFLTTFTTNRIYSAINLRTDGIYSGEEKLLTSHLGLGDIVYELVLLVPDEPERVLSGAEVADRFDYDAVKHTYKAKSSKIDVKSLYFKYTFIFEDSARETVYLQIIKSLSDDGGENQEFESSNPFDELFMSSDTPWVNGGVFTVPEDKTFHYAYIGIVSVNGEDYDPAASNNICYIDFSLNTGGPSDRFDDVLYTAGEEFTGPPYYGHAIFSGVDGLNTTYYKTIRFFTDRDYVPDYNVSVRVRCWYLNSATPDIVLIQDYVIIIPGIFKCYDINRADPVPADATPDVFTDRTFYDLTMDLFYENHPDLYASYVSEFTDWEGGAERVLLSDSSYATVDLDYSGLAGSGVDVEGIQRLKNVVRIKLDNIEVANTRAFSDMSDSALEYLSLSNCKMTDDALYSSPGASQSYLYNIHLKEIDLSENSLTRTDKLLSRTVTLLDMSGQRDSGAHCLTDIAGLYNLTSLRTLDVSGNAILRFEVLRTLSTLRDVYIYDNISYIADVNGELYGTDGRVNIPHYVSAIKNFGTRIHANQDDIASYIMIDRDMNTNYIKFSIGGNISAEQEEGSIVLNAFATQTKIYSKAAVWMLMYELYNLKVSSSQSGIWNGETGTDGYYKFMFCDYYNQILSQTQIAFLSKDGGSAVTVGTADLGAENDITFDAYVTPGTYSYIIAVFDQYGHSLAFREFLVEIVSLS